MESKKTIQEVLQEIADDVSIERGEKYVPKVLLSNIASGGKKPKKPKRKKK